VWQKAMDLTIAVYEITRSFPKEELFSSASQVKRSCSSIHANLAEGNAVSHFKKKELSFYVNALGSAQETRSWFIQAHRLKYITDQQFETLNNDCIEIVKMLTALIQRVKRETTGEL
jgi:four helix bundle protein